MNSLEIFFVLKFEKFERFQKYLYSNFPILHEKRISELYANGEKKISEIYSGIYRTFIFGIFAHRNRDLISFASSKGQCLPTYAQHNHFSALII